MSLPLLVIAMAVVLFLMISRKARFALGLFFMRLFRPFNGNNRDKRNGGKQVVRRW
ncbi:MAG: hypothetical protein QW074_05190 [Candidatus Caldarchaeum sp.]